MSKNETQQTDADRTIVTYENEDISGRAAMRTPSHEDSEVRFARMMDEPSELHQKILEEAAQMGIPTHIIDLPPMLTPQYEDDQMYVGDCNNVIRYYFGGPGAEGQLVPTDDFINNAQMVESNERTNSFEKIYNVA